jgi:opacity protein-like surface antigen
MKRSVLLIFLLAFAGASHAQVGLRLLRMYSQSDEPASVQGSTAAELHFSYPMDRNRRLHLNAGFAFVPFNINRDPLPLVITQTDGGLGTVTFEGFQLQKKFNTSLFSFGAQLYFIRGEKLSVCVGADAMAGRYRTVYERVVPQVLQESIDDRFYAYGYRFRLGVDYHFSDRFDIFATGHSQHTRFEARYWGRFVDVGVGVKYWFNRKL